MPLMVMSKAVMIGTRLVQRPQIEQVVRVLPIQGRHQIACIQLVTREDCCIELDAEEIAGLGAQWFVFHRQNGATENDVHFDFGLTGVVLEDQLGAAQVLAADQPRLHAKWRDPLCDGGQFAIYPSQRFIALHLPGAVRSRNRFIGYFPSNIQSKRKGCTTDQDAADSAIALLQKCVTFLHTYIRIS